MSIITSCGHEVFSGNDCIPVSSLNSNGRRERPMNKDAPPPPPGLGQCGWPACRCRSAAEADCREVKRVEAYFSRWGEPAPRNSIINTTKDQGTEIMADDNVVTLQQPEPPRLLIGPFEVWKVQVDGRIIPRLTGREVDGRIELTVDNRFAAYFAKEDAYGAAWLIAHALAIGAGYAYLGAENKDRPFAPQGCAISSLPEKD